MADLTVFFSRFSSKNISQNDVSSVIQPVQPTLSSFFNQSGLFQLLNEYLYQPEHSSLLSGMFSTSIQRFSDLLARYNQAGELNQSNLKEEMTAVQADIQNAEYNIESNRPSGSSSGQQAPQQQNEAASSNAAFQAGDPEHQLHLLLQQEYEQMQSWVDAAYNRDLAVNDLQNVQTSTLNETMNRLKRDVGQGEIQSLDDWQVNATEIDRKIDQDQQALQMDSGASGNPQLINDEYQLAFDRHEQDRSVLVIQDLQRIDGIKAFISRDHSTIDREQAIVTRQDSAYQSTLAEYQKNRALLQHIQGI